MEETGAIKMGAGVTWVTGKSFCTVFAFSLAQLSPSDSALFVLYSPLFKEEFHE
jgi:hypothetical protein